MLQELRTRVSRGKTIQEATVQKYLTVVSAVLSDAKRNEIIQKNPARMIDLPMTEQRIQKIPTPEEAQEILSMLNEEPFVYRVFFFLAIYTGCRRCELAGLRWKDFSLDEKGGAILTVQRSRSVVVGQGVTEGRTKNGRARQLYIEPEVMDILAALRYEQRRASDYLFTNEEGNPIHPDTFTKRLRRLYDAYGFPKGFHLHTLRHFFVTSMLHNGVDKQTVAELAGHGDTGFLERTYCHPQMELKRQASKRMTGDLLPMSVKNESA